MASSLQRQLAALAAPSSAILVPDRRRASIIFTAAEAAKYDRETFYQIGLEGLKELDEINPKLFSKYFQSIIFDEDSKNLERAVMNEESNTMLDQIINEFLIAVSPYMMIKAPLKCIEWLVHRFHIETFNVGAIVQCVLPYYDTKTFVLVMKVLEIEKFQKHNEWSWLLPSIQTGLPVPKTTLFSNCNSQFIQWIFDTLGVFLDVHRHHMGNVATFLAFMTSTLLGILSGINESKRPKSKAKDSGNKKVVVTLVWNKILNLLEWLNNSSELDVIENENLHSSVYIVITMLMIVRKERPDISVTVPATPIMNLILETCPLSLQSNMILVLNLMASSSFWNGLSIREDSLLEITLTGIKNLSMDMDVYPIAGLILKSQLRDRRISSSELWVWVDTIQMTSHQRSQLLKDLFYLCKHEKVQKFSERLMPSKFAVDFERRYPIEFSLAIESDENFAQECVKSANASDLKNLTLHADANLRKDALIQTLKKANGELKKVLKGSKLKKTNGIKLKKSKGSGELKKSKGSGELKKSKGSGELKKSNESDELEKSNESELEKSEGRRKRKKSLESHSLKLDKNMFAKSILRRFDDDDVDVALILLTQKVKFLRKIFSVDKLMQGYVQILKKRLSKKCTKLALNNIFIIANRLKDNQQQHKAEILTHCIPFLFPSKELGMKLAMIILRSEFAGKHPFLSKYSEFLKDENVDHESLCKFSYNLMSTEKPELNSSHWMTELKKNNKIGLLALLSLITIRDTNDAQLIFSEFEKEILRSHVPLPVVPGGILKQIKVVEKEKQISLEMLLTALTNVAIQDKQLIERIFNFALIASEKPENRVNCTLFLQQFLNKNFKKSSDLLEFWMQMILKNRDDYYETHKSEYLMLRSLQFLSNIFQKLSLTSAAETKKNDDDEQRLNDFDLSPPSSHPVTRKSIIQNLSNAALSSPARNTRSSLRGLGDSLLALPATTTRTRQNSEGSSRLDSTDLESETGRKSSQELLSMYKKESSDLVELLLTQCVQHESSLVRHWGLNCISVLLDWQHLENLWREIIIYVLRFRSAIESDRTQVGVAVSKMLSEKGNLRVQDRFLQIVTDDKKSDLIRFGFLELISQATFGIFDKLVQFIQPLIKQNPASKLLSSYLDTFDGSLTFGNINVIKDCLKHKETAKKILSKLKGAVFDKLDLTWKQKLFGIMIDSSANCDTSEVKVGIQRTVRKWILDTSIITSELEICLLIQKKQSASLGSLTSVRSANANGTSKRKSVSFALPVVSVEVDASVDWVSRTEAVLEFAQSGKQLKRKTKLIQPLIKLLRICISMEEQTPVEYLKQLILTSLTISCEEEQDENERSNMDDWINFEVDSVIDCLRCSRNPQTHHHALILLNYAAKRFPEQVLHGVMSLFTFMGNSILRQDDSYSTQLIQQTVETIIPTLATSGDVRQYSRSLISAGIYRVFTSAVQDIPVHRRLPIFTSLVQVLDPVESMWQVCFIIVDNALAGNNKSKRNVLKADLELATNLLWNFEASSVLKTLEKMYMYLSELPIYDKVRNQDFEKCKSSQSAWSKSVVDLTRKQNLREAQLVINFTLELIAKAVVKFEGMDDKTLSYETLLEKCLSFTRLLSHGLNEDKTFRLIANRNFEVIDKINSALAPVEFVEVVQFILTKDDVSIKKKMLDIFNQRIIQRMEWFGDVTILMKLLPNLLECMDPESENEDAAPFIQTVFLSLKLMARHLALKFPDEFVPVFDMSYSQARNKNPLLASSALLCLSELFCLKSLILPKLTDVTKSILKSLKAQAKLAGRSEDSDAEVGGNENEIVKPSQSKNKVGGEIASSGSKGKKEDSANIAANLLLISGVTSLNKLIEQIGAFVSSSFLSKSLVAVLSIPSLPLSAFGEGDRAENSKKTFEQKLKVLLKTISIKIPLRNSLVSIKKSFNKLTENPGGLVLVLKLLRDSLVATEKTDFTNLLPSLFDMFMNDLLSYRDRRSDEEGDIGLSSQVVAVEDSVVECLVSGIILKLSEGTFRPFYHRLFDWASENLERKITFYRLSAYAAERLKSLFVTFAGHVITPAASCLNEHVELTRAILKYFYNIFFNDKEGFITTDRFNIIIKPLIDLIESEAVVADVIPIKDVSSALIKLAVATNDLNRWQNLIDHLSAKSQSTDSRVRLFTIKILEAVANELEKDFLPLLPPAIPFLADLLGDDDETVEAATKKMLIKLEAIVGEPLQPYFNT